MGLFNRKSQFQRVLDAVSDLDMPNGVKSPSDPGKAAKVGLAAAGGLAALTAASAGISSLRRRMEGTGDDS